MYFYKRFMNLLPTVLIQFTIILLLLKNYKTHQGDVLCTYIQYLLINNFFFLYNFPVFKKSLKNS